MNFVKLQTAAERLNILNCSHAIGGFFGFCVFSLLFLTGGYLFSEESSPSPSDAPVEAETSKRSRIVLNGIWEFAPAVFPLEQRPASGEWGLIRVPGYWRSSAVGTPGLESHPNTPLWKGYKTAVKCGWYKRRINIPKNWKNTEISLSMKNVMADARVYLNGKYAGDIRHPKGDLDISNFVEPGGNVLLEVLVCSFSNPSDFEKLTKLSKEAYGKTKAIGGRRGIGGDVLLLSRPKGTRIDGVFVRTSVQAMEIAADIDIIGVRDAGDYEIKCRILDSKGAAVKKFSKKVALDKSSLQRLSVSEKWENPVLWDTENPVLYDMEIALVRGGKTIDKLRQRFGFREFCIMGKDFYLNGKKIHLRPLHNFFEGGAGGSRQAISNHIDSMMKCNFNAMELWPWDQQSRGADHFRPIWAEIADEKGFLILYPAYAFRKVYWSKGAMRESWEWDNSVKRKEWMKAAISQWKEVRNSPSVIAFMTLPNTLSIADDNNPVRMGNSVRLNGESEWMDRVAQSRKKIEWLKRLDPTRPVASHDGANIGDFHAMNNYLDFIPLQEREEWLSEWARSGNIPYMAIEFGTPFICNFQRDRSGPYRAWCSEPLLTEFAATYFGEKAYDMEASNYRDMIAREYKGGLLWNKLVNLPEFEFAKLHSEFQGFFIKHTWRAWRAWGISGGMVPWRDGYGWVPKGDKLDLPFKEGALGWQPAQMFARDFFGMSGAGVEITASGKALIENQRPAIAWIAGKAGAFTDKSHHFYGGEKIAKQIAILNDTRHDAKYEFAWRVELGEKVVASGKASGTAAVSDRLFLPFSADIPEVAKKSAGKIFLEGVFDGKPVSDSFDFAAYPKVSFAKISKLKIFDPDASLAPVLDSFGLDFAAWDGSACGGVLVVAENALGKRLPGNLLEFVKKGGKLLILGQDKATLKSTFGMRVSEHVARRMFTVASQSKHPLVSGLAADDFRDWRGSGKRVPEYADIAHAMTDRPDYGYHWGNRGSVASVTLEKPHYSSWRPILEGQFDLSYTPLMEKEFGSGLAVFCGLDIGARTERDPVADEMFSRLLKYLDSFKPSAICGDSPAVYVGGKRGAALLRSFGMNFIESKSLPKSGFAVVGEDSGLDDAQIEAALNGGVNMILIERGKARFGLRMKDGKLSSDAKVPQWPEAAGISRSDVHTRVDIPAKLFEGGDTGAGGLWARIKKGKGVAVAFALLPDELDTANKKYLRLTAWRMSRALSQLAGNLGAAFISDTWLLDSDSGNPRNTKIPIAGLWKYSVERGIKNGDPSAADYDDYSWDIFEINKHIDSMGNTCFPYREIYWVRKSFRVQESWKAAGKFVLSLGRIVGGDSVYLNGKQIAKTPKHPDTWTKYRFYEIPQDALNFGGNNVLAVRVEPYSSGRIWAKDSELYIKADIASPYSKDYIDNQTDGDNPFRYLKW